MSSDGPSLPVRLLEALSLVLCCAAGGLFMLAMFVRFANRRLRVFDALNDNAYGIYLVHYLFTVWLQFVLLGLAVIAVIKAAIVFCGALVLSWGLVTAMRQASHAIGIIGPARRSAPAPSLPSPASRKGYIDLLSRALRVRRRPQTNRGAL
jgi:peptidoglycan/LPS O-acetylase OafA/YrhL